MTSMSEDEREYERNHISEVLAVSRQRLRYRELQRTRLGDTADPSILADIEKLQREIASLEPADLPDLPPETRAIIKRRLDDDMLVFHNGVLTNQRVTRIEGAVADSIERLVKVEEQVGTVLEQVHMIVQSIYIEHQERIQGQRNRLQWQIATFALLVFLVLLVTVYLVWRL